MEGSHVRVAILATELARDLADETLGQSEARVGLLSLPLSSSQNAHPEAQPPSQLPHTRSLCHLETCAQQTVVLDVIQPVLMEDFGDGKGGGNGDKQQAPFLSLPKHGLNLINANFSATVTGQAEAHFDLDPPKVLEVPGLK